ncbi:MAG: C39 family peptidase [Candidatus Berkelbacteria bacterium]
MSFIQFFKNKRTKLILSIIAAFVILGGGTIFALAKTGKIDIRSFADEVASVVIKSPASTETKGLSSGNVNIYVKSNNTSSASFVGQNTIVDIYYGNAWNVSAYTNAYSDAVFQLPTTGPYYAIVRGSNCPTVPFYAPAASFYIYAYCQAIPAGNFTVKGVVKDQTSGLPIEGITVQAAPGSDKSFATTASDGSYTLNITPISYTSSANYHLYFSDYSKTRPILYQYDNKTLDKFIGNVSNIPTNSPYTATVPEYMYLSAGDGLSLAGTIYGPKTDGTSGDQLVAGATVQILNAASGTGMTAAVTSSASTSADGTRSDYPYNFKTATFSFNSTDISSLSVKITAPGYADFGPTPLKNADIIYQNSGSLTLGELNVLAEYDLTLAPPPATFDLVGLVTGSDTKAALTGATITASCPPSVSAANCQLPTINPVVSISPPANTHGVTSTLNYGLSNLYNIKLPGSKIPSFTITIAKSGYVSQIITANTSDIKTDTAGKLYAVENAELVKIIPTTLLGQVVASENHNLGVPTTVYLYNDDEPNALIAHKDSDSSGNYNFGSLPTSIVAGKNYRLVAVPTAANRSSEILTVTINAGSNTKNIILAKNDGKNITVFEGNISKISNDAKVPIKGAKIILLHQRDGAGPGNYLPGDIVGQPVLSDTNGNYTLPVTNLVSEGDTPAAPTNVKLFATDVSKPLFSLSPKSESKLFNLTDIRGSKIFQDFVFGDNSNTSPIVGRKKVVVTFEKSIIKYKDRTNTSSAETYVVNQGGAAGISVRLACQRSASSAGDSNFIDYTDPVVTLSNGTATFNNVPKSDCQVVFSVDPSWKIAGTVVIAPESTTGHITLTRPDWDPGALANAEGRIAMAQTDPAWGVPSPKPYGFNDGADLHNSGCCVTTLAMALKFYYPNDNITPATLTSFGNANQADMHVQNFPSFVLKYDASTGKTVHLVKIEAANLDSSMQNYLKQGVPIIFYGADGQLRNMNNGSTYGTHCVLLTQYFGGSTYHLIDSWNGKAFNYARDQLGGFGGTSVAYAVIDDRQMATFARQVNGQNSAPDNKLTGTVSIPAGASTSWHENINTTAFGGICDTSAANQNKKHDFCQNDSTANESTANMSECLTCQDSEDNCIGFSGVYTGCHKQTEFFAALPYSVIAAACGGKANNCPRIEVQYNGKSVILAVVDAGPGVGTSGTKNSDYVLRGGRPTYSAGLDISPAAMQALGAESGNIMRWRFTTGSSAVVAVDNNSGAVNNSLAANIIRSLMNPVVSAEAASGTITVKPLSNVVVSTTVSTLGVIPVENAFVSLSLANNKKVTLKMTKQPNGSYKLTIPKALVVSDFSYQILAYNSYNVQFSSTLVPIHVTQSSAAQSATAKVLDTMDQLPQSYQNVQTKVGNFFTTLSLKLGSLL